MTRSMDSCSANAKVPSTAAEWARVLSRFRTPANGRGAIELLVTLVPFVATWVLTWLAWSRHIYWATVPLSIVASGFLVRLFLIQHDCGHAGFFASRQANDWLGRMLGILTLTPYAYWRKTHAIHHATHGNLDRRGVGDVDTLTVAEYLARPRWARLRYRLYRHPVVMFGIGPAYVFIVSNRLPAGFMRSGWRPWVSTMGTNLAVVLTAFLLGRAIGFDTLLAVHAPILLTAAMAGVWLFYVQHQFEHSHWRREDAWKGRDAALLGSSHYAMPGILRWFTANIGVHHVHHLSSGVPFYRLPDVLGAWPALAATNRITLRESFHCAALTLWDEDSQRLVRFADLRGHRSQS
jgi:omega-6 fatty acid desaturase (delta-12 desaturase)